MSDIAMHKTPAWTVPAKRQFAMLKDSNVAWVMIAVCCASMFFVEFLRVHRNPGPGATGASLQHPLMNVQFFLYVLAAIWPLMVWRDEAWGKREYHWSLPVNRSSHDLWRFATGAAWLMISVGACAMLGMFLLHLHGDAMHLPDGTHAHFRPGSAFWVSFFTGPLIVYAFASIPPIALRRPLEWGAAIVTGTVIWIFFADTTHLTWMTKLPSVILSTGTYNLGLALSGGATIEFMNFLVDAGFFQASIYSTPLPLTRWMIAAALWLGLGVLGVTLALRRRR